MFFIDLLVAIARRLPEPAARVLAFGLIVGFFIISVLVLFIIVPLERTARLRWRRISRR
jgi:hypothetical protein